MAGKRKRWDADTIVSGLQPIRSDAEPEPTSDGGSESETAERPDARAGVGQGAVQPGSGILSFARDERREGGPTGMVGQVMDSQYGDRAIVEIDPKLIDTHLIRDRLPNWKKDHEYAELLTSIERTGQEQPILVRRGEIPGRYDLVYGARRREACLELGRPVLARISRDMDQVDAYRAMFSENNLRSGLSFLERGLWLHDLRERAGLSAAQLMQITGMAESTLSEGIRAGSLSRKIIDILSDARQLGRRAIFKLIAESESEAKLQTMLERAQADSEFQRRSLKEQVDILLRGPCSPDVTPGSSTASTLIEAYADRKIVSSDGRVLGTFLARRGRLVVRFEDDVTPDAIEKIVKAAGAALGR